MRIAIISDLHSNAVALRAVLTDAARQGTGQVLCLGDVVGYHAMARETIATLREQSILSVSGNHDLMVVGALPERCGPLGRRALAWTRENLSTDDLDFLRGLPPVLCQQGRLVCLHSAPDDPEVRLRSDDQYITAARSVWTRYPAAQVCFTGHTHEPAVVTVSALGYVSRGGPPEAELTSGGLSFVNPGSVGRPLDGDHRAAYAIFDCMRNTVEFLRVDYDTVPLLRANAAAGIDTPYQKTPRVRERLRAWLSGATAAAAE